jgi:HSP20 family molecular chaperone IbpA
MTRPAKDRAVDADGSIRLASIHDLVGRTREVQDLIAQRAYQLYEYGALQQGDELERWLRDWVQAESEVLCPVRVFFHESDDCLQVDLEVPGFTAGQLELSIDPVCLAISGKRTCGKDSAILHAFRVVTLPVKVDPCGMTASFEQGVLRLSIPKEHVDTSKHLGAHCHNAKQKMAAGWNALMLLA